MNLFLVTFGKPTINTSFGYGNKTMFIIANDYNEAAHKALCNYEADKTNSVLNSDGDLILSNEDVQIESIKLLTENLIK